MPQVAERWEVILQSHEKKLPEENRFVSGSGKYELKDRSIVMMRRV
jgi:hypothetical protein